MYSTKISSSKNITGINQMLEIYYNIKYNINSINNIAVLLHFWLIVDYLHLWFSSILISFLKQLIEETLEFPA